MHLGGCLAVVLDSRGPCADRKVGAKHMAAGYTRSNALEDEKKRVSAVAAMPWRRPLACGNAPSSTCSHFYPPPCTQVTRKKRAAHRREALENVKKVPYLYRCQSHPTTRPHRSTETPFLPPRPSGPGIPLPPTRPPICTITASTPTRTSHKPHAPTLARPPPTSSAWWCRSQSVWRPPFVPSPAPPGSHEGR